MQRLPIFLFGALIVLAFLGSCKQNPPTGGTEAVATTAAPAQTGHRIGYVNIDTLYEKYTWFKDQKANLEKRVTDGQKSMANKEEAFMKRVQAFQAKAQSGNVPPIELEKEQNKLAAEEQGLQKESARLSQSLEEEGVKANEQLLATLENKLKEIRTQIGYDYILGYQRGNPTILLANEELDVTNKVLELLNAQEAAK
jgi:Skp family chaperone for outer membrane proteins